MSVFNVNLQICDECWQQYCSVHPVLLRRRSHKTSFWCEHLIPENGYGREVPINMWIGQEPAQ